MGDAGRRDGSSPTACVSRELGTISLSTSNHTHRLASCNHNTSGSYSGVIHMLRTSIFLKHRSILHGLVFPRVHAQDVSSENSAGADDDKHAKPTAIDRIIARPKGYQDGMVSDAEVQRYLDNESGEERLRCMFSKTSDGEMHSDLTTPLMPIIGCTTLTFFLGTLAGSQQAKEAFIKKNVQTKFETKIQASRSAKDAMFIGASKVGMSWAIRSCVFSTIFMMTSQCISTYRNESSLLEYMIGGALTGGFLRSHLGLRGLVGGAAIGFTLGGLGGSAMLLALHWGGETQDIRHYWQVKQQLQQRRDLEIMEKGAQAARSTVEVQSS